MTRRCGTVALTIGLVAIGLVLAPQVALAKNPSAKNAATAATIEANAEGAPRVDGDRMNRRSAGYYRVKGADGPAEPAYWVPRGQASVAPAEIRATNAFQASKRIGAHSQAGELIYSPTASVLYYGSSSSLARVSGFNSCPNGWFCMWRNSGYSGRMIQLSSTGFWQNLSAYGFNDRASSLRNRKSNKATKVAKNNNGGGGQLCYRAGSAASALGSWNDKISSIKIKNNNNC